YVSTEVNSDGEMSPRTKFNSTGYSFKTGGLETNTGAPVTGVREGRSYFNTSNNTLYVYTGGNWVAAGGGGSGSLQAAYAGGATITTSGTDIGISLTTTGTDANFTVTTDPGATGFTSFSLADGAN